MHCSGGIVIRCGECVGDECGSLRRIGAGCEADVEIVLGNADPVERVGQNARDLAYLGGFVRRLNEALDWEGIAECAVNTGGNLRPTRLLFHAGGQTGQ